MQLEDACGYKYITSIVDFYLFVSACNIVQLELDNSRWRNAWFVRRYVLDNK